jgi:hypothetical protein
LRGIGDATKILRDEIRAAFAEADLPVTVRQMYYLLTVRGAVEKSEAGYRQVQRQLVLMRREGLLDYDWIADNTRWVRRPTTYSGVADALRRTAASYRRDVWENLPVYVELWCEKDALAGVLMDVTGPYDVPLMVARGFASESFVYSAAETIKASGKPGFIYYLGDFDPSGWNMSVNLGKKLQAFGADITFKRLAVNLQQIGEWKLPTRETKRTDTRCREFFDIFGADAPSVELDAIHPNELRRIVREAIVQHIPAGYLEYLKMVEAEDKVRWKKLCAVARRSA